MKYKVKVLQEREVEAGNVFRHAERGDLMMLAPVPLEDGTYVMAASRWILISLDLFSATWGHEFHSTPGAALAGAPWEFYAESPEAAFKRKRAKRVKR